MVIMCPYRNKCANAYVLCFLCKYCNQFREFGKPPKK